MLSRSGGPRSRKPPTGLPVACRPAACLAVAATLLVTWISLSQLAHLISPLEKVSAGEVIRASGWHSVIGETERNLESHLPRWRGVDTQAPITGSAQAGLGEASKPQLTLSTEPAAQKKDGAATRPVSGQCNIAPHTDYGWGDPVKWGTSNLVNSAEACCQQCLHFKPKSASDQTCNVWVWCGEKAGCGAQYRECWLKHLAHPDAAAPREGPSVPWTAGVVASPSRDESADVVTDPSEDRSFHIVITAEGSAVHWQARVHYYWYKKIKAQCEAKGKCQMGGFTRLLHSGKADDLMDEIPSYVVNPLPPDKQDHKGYVVLNRPYAFAQWTQQVTIKEKYVIMSEPDHVWLKPMPNLMKGRRPAAFPFFYIEPSKKEFLHITEKFTGPLTTQQAETIAPIGNAPTMMAWEDLVAVSPLWMNISLAIFNDVEAAKEWGWVQEMYAFTIACYNAGVPRVDLHRKMMSQPPWDSAMDPYYILHYTYGMDYTKDGVFTPGKYGEWRFDKRTYASLPPPRNLGMPPSGMPNALVRHLVSAINEASSHIPGWDDYAATGVAKQLWDGKL